MTNDNKQRAPTPDELARRVQQLERENRRLRERCEEAELEAVELEKRLKNTENTLSFRLGYAIIQATKSSDGMRALPGVLAELRRDSKRTKQRGESSLLSAVTRSSLAAVERLVRSRSGR